MPRVTSASFFICERVLIEKDDINSAIRIVELFNLPAGPPPPGMPPLDQVAVWMTVVGILKFDSWDAESHTLQVQLVRPDGESVFAGPPSVFEIATPSAAPNFPPGINFLSTTGVFARQMGLHYFVLFFDGIEVARAPFALRVGEQVTA